MPMTPLEIATKLLVHFDEVSGNFVDSSIYGASMRKLGAASGVSASSKFGARCYELASTGGGYDGHGFNSIGIGSLPFYVECQFYQYSAPGGPRALLQGPSNLFGIFINAAGNIEGNTFNGLTSQQEGVVGPAAALNTWTHVLYGIDGDGVRRLFVNGTQASSRVDAHRGGDTVGEGAVGTFLGNSGTSFHGRIDEVRVVIGLPCPTSNFTAPTAAYANPVRDFGYSAALSPARLPGAPKPVGNFKNVQTPRIVQFDRTFGGDGRIVGTVKEKSTPTNTPLARKVRLYQELSGKFARETWSDAVTGNYAFTNLDRTQRYTVVTYDYVNNYRAVVADNLLPEPM